MEKPSNSLDDSTRKLVVEAGLHKSDLDFSKLVVDAIKSKRVNSTIYHPLISKRSWIFIAIGIIACLISLYLIPSTGKSLFDSFVQSNTLKLDFTLPKFKLSKTVVYAIGFMSLFLVQIPFLKQYLIKK